MPYRPPKMTPLAAARERSRVDSRKRSKLNANARMRKTLKTPGDVVSLGMNPLALPVRVGVGALAAIAAKTAAGKYAPKYGTSGPRSLPEYKATVKTALRERKNPTKSKWIEENPHTRVVKAYAKAPFEKDRNTKPPTTNAEAAAKLRATRAKAKTSPTKRKR